MATTPQQPAERSLATPLRLWAQVAVFGLLVAAIGWAYWPALLEITASWSRDPDYSHGYLVAPIALAFLWLKRDRLNTDLLTSSWAGFGLLALAAGIRFYSGKFFLGPIDAWTIPLSLAGAVLLVFGWGCLKWSLPGLIFLYFMIPLPYSAETMLSVPLQGVATRFSTEVLQLLGQPAIAEGNVIWLEDHPLNVAEACSGLRILVAVFALAFAFVLFSNWAWWQKALVLLAAVPVALVANMLRIVTTGLLHRLVSGEAAHQFSHDLAGFVMIPVAALLFWLILMYFERLFPHEELLSPSAVVGAAARRG